jgi:hypothetical protein
VAFLTSCFGEQVSFRPTIASADVPDADPLLFANGASKESATHGRASRAAMRKQTQAFGASTSDAFRFNQVLRMLLFVFPQCQHTEAIRSTEWVRAA